MNIGLFRIVEIEINTGCNRSCSHCPNSMFPTRVQSFIPSDRFCQMLHSISTTGFAGRLSFHLYNEPLLHPKLELLISSARKILPGAIIVVMTNGDLLDDARYMSLTSAGAHHFFVTRHDGGSFPKRLQQNVVYPDRDLVLTNRGGALPVNKLHQPLEIRCLAPSEMLIVTIAGDVLCCYEDYRQEMVIGNLLQSPVEDVWLSKRFENFRKLLAAGRRNEASAICRRCNNKNHLQPQLLDDLVSLGDSGVIA